mmetsp:Transcript_42499/g.65213  ORF Transcript_42499/g.65213 Transcript_42499/m.65213 type:complete len:114 (+) Transcript_42499:400-741(+)
MLLACLAGIELVFSIIEYKDEELKGDGLSFNHRSYFSTDEQNVNEVLTISLLLYVIQGLFFLIFFCKNSKGTQGLILLASLIAVINSLLCSVILVLLEKDGGEYRDLGGWVLV